MSLKWVAQIPPEDLLSLSLLLALKVALVFNSTNPHNLNEEQQIRLLKKNLHLFFFFLAFSIYKDTFLAILAIICLCLKNMFLGGGS